MRGLLALILMAGLIAGTLFLLRYDVDIDSPIIVKLDRWTGQTWVANSGVWMDIVHK